MTLGVVLALVLASIQVTPGGKAQKQGRDGNAHLKGDRFDEAQSAYQRGLSVYENGREADQTYYGLQQNLGIALYRQEDFEGAQRAFDTAMASAPTEHEAARAAYNAGNNAFSRQAAEDALAHYRTALLADPHNEDAKFNYEFISRQLQEQNQQNSDQGDNEEPEQQNQEQQQNQGQQDQQQEQDEQQQDQAEQQNGEEEPQPEQQEEQGEQAPLNPQELTREQAERILEALENEEEELLRNVQKVKGRPRRVAKDW